MHVIKILGALICITQAFGSGEPFGLHLRLSEQDNNELLIKNDDSQHLPAREEFEFDFHSLQHNISYDQESTCVWTRNRTQQYCVFADPQFNHGKGVTIITTPERAQHFFNSNVYALNDHDFVQKPLFRTIAGSSKGRGIFANSFIRASSLIVQESPFIFIDQNWVEGVPSEDTRIALQALAIRKLPIVTQRIFQELFGSPNIDNHSQKILTNSYGTTGGPTRDWPGLENESDSGMISVHANMSKINHGCRANAVAQWDWDLLAHKLYAVRDIAADEEITISYFDTIQTHRERQQYTKKMLGFQCACSYCSATSKFIDLSDDRVHEILLLEHSLNNRQIAPAEPTAMAELLVNLYEQEELDLYIARAYAIAALEWNGVGKEYQARSWAYKSIKAGLIVGASASAGVEEYLEDMQALLDGARKHWSWKHRAY